VAIARKETCIELGKFIVQESSLQIMSPEPPFLLPKTQLSKRDKEVIGTRIPLPFTEIWAGLFYM